MKKIMKIIPVALFFIPAIFFAHEVKANPAAPGIQLAWFVGYHSSSGGYVRPGDPYYTPGLRMRIPKRTTWFYVKPQSCVSCLRERNVYSQPVRCNGRC